MLKLLGCVMIIMGGANSLIQAASQRDVKICFLNKGEPYYPVQLSLFGAIALEFFHQRYVAHELPEVATEEAHQMLLETRRRIAQYIGTLINQRVQEGQMIAAGLCSGELNSIGDEACPLFHAHSSEEPVIKQEAFKMPEESIQEKDIEQSVVIIENKPSTYIVKGYSKRKRRCRSVLMKKINPNEMKPRGHGAYWCVIHKRKYTGEHLKKHVIRFHLS